MHTLETAVALPLLFLILGGGLFLCVHTVNLIDQQVMGYSQTPGTDAKDCVRVLRVTEVIYEIFD